ncbi:MAG: cyclic-di-AMP receptor [Anaerolineae bacterium]|nr:cyclic-di-AMP receptor [Anaerolineae bacterium]
MTTKLILIVASGTGYPRISNLLLDRGYHVTEFSSTGSFFRRKNTTLLIGLPAGDVEPVLEQLRQLCATLPEADEHNATIFVLNAGHTIQV